MAWTTPKTFVAGAVLTAAELNTHLRDNLNETCPATVTTAGDLVYADAANSMGSRLAIGGAGAYMVSDGSAPVWRDATSAQANSAVFTFTNTSYLDLDAVTGGTPGTACAVTVTTGTTAIVMWRSRLQNDTAGQQSFVAYRISGASTQAANDDKALWYESSVASDNIAMGTQDRVTGLTAGSNTFELQARVSGGTATLRYNEIVVIAL